MTHRNLISILLASSILLPISPTPVLSAPLSGIAATVNPTTKKKKKNKRGKTRKGKEKKAEKSIKSLANKIFNPTDELKEQAKAYLESTKNRGIIIAMQEDDDKAVYSYLITNPGDRQFDFECACHYGKEKYARLLLAAPGIDVNKADNDGRTPLHNTITNSPETVKLLLTAPGIDVNKAENHYGRAPLHFAVAINEGYPENVKLLLATPGIDVNKADKFGQTPLHWAVTNTPENVKLLLAAPGIDVNKADNNGRTPLHCAKNAECIKLLLATPGINLNIADKDGKTPLQRAKEEEETEIVQLLEAAGAK
ncbi:MAG: ankyrin repeat domain-containing protein [Akkermansia sp.]|nr:ankyrin repeat domain-containing protein [Akkermansia sp.]